MLECYVSVLSRGPEGGQDGTERKQRHEGLTFLPDGPHSPKWVISSPTSICLEKRYRDASAWCACALKRHILVLLSQSKHLKCTLFSRKMFCSVDATMLINTMLLK